MPSLSATYLGPIHLQLDFFKNTQLKLGFLENTHLQLGFLTGGLKLKPRSWKPQLKPQLKTPVVDEQGLTHKSVSDLIFSSF